MHGLKNHYTKKSKHDFKNHFCTGRQQVSFDEVEEEVYFYHQTNLEDTIIMMENGLEAEGIDRTMGRTNDKDEDFER